MVIMGKLFREENTHFGSTDPILTIPHFCGFGNPARTRHLKIGILQFDIWKRGHFDILELDILLF